MGRTKICARGVWAVLLLVGCGDDQRPAPSDAMDDSDAPDANGSGLSCSDPYRTPQATLDVGVTFDTTDDAVGVLDLGPECGNRTMMSPQRVIEYRVPGEGPYQVRFTTLNDSTATNFDTLLQVREICEQIPTQFFPDTCFDDADADERRSWGRFTAEGGDLFYVIATGYFTEGDFTDRGPMRVEMMAIPNALPVLADASVEFVGDEITISVTGSDTDGDAVGVGINFLNDQGDVIDMFTRDGRVGVLDTFLVPFDESVDGQAEFSSVATSGFGQLARGFGATDVRVWLYDAGHGASEERVLALDPTGGFDEPCGAAEVCGPELTCVADVCAPLPEITGACSAADMVELEPPTGTTTQTVVSAEIQPGDGLFGVFCGRKTDHTSGDEAIFQIQVPEGDLDLVVRTNIDSVPESTPTILYVRRSCEDPSSVIYPGCGVNVGGTDFRSLVEINEPGPGVYTVFAEFDRGAPSVETFDVEIALRPVLDSGDACDDAGEDNRCRHGTCTDGVCS